MPALNVTREGPAPEASARVHLLDVLRSAALLAMVGFHLGVDLELFGLAPHGMSRQGAWWWAARLIAGSFLFLAGVSLWLAHGRVIRWAAFWRREGVIIAAALAVSLVTYLMMEPVFVHFGILHSIAAASLIGLALLRLPALLIALIAAAVFWLGNFWSAPLFAAPYFWWTGLSPLGSVRPSMDFEPVFPWAAAFLAGLAFAKVGAALGLWQKLRGKGGPLAETLGWPGRHSLAIYLIHQPVLFAAFSGLRWLGLI